MDWPFEKRDLLSQKSYIYDISIYSQVNHVFKVKRPPNESWLFLKTMITVENLSSFNR